MRGALINVHPDDVTLFTKAVEYTKKTYSVEVELIDRGNAFHKYKVTAEEDFTFFYLGYHYKRFIENPSEVGD